MEGLRVGLSVAPVFLCMDVERREGNVSTKAQRDLQEMWAGLLVWPHSAEGGRTGSHGWDGFPGVNSQR